MLFRSLPNKMILYGHGPSFCVSKELIRGNSIEVYKKLINLFYAEDLIKNLSNKNEALIEIGKIYHDRFLRFWKVLFTHKKTNKKFKIKYH